MSRTVDSPTGFESFADDPTPAQQVQQQLRGKVVCPFCGTLSQGAEGACARCTMENTPLTRQATKARLGPWYVLQSRNPAAPGMKYSVLLSLVKKGQITPRSIVRGPTTNQFWRFAAKVRGLSREFGICWGCGQDIATDADVCPHCQRSQLPPANPDQLLDSRQPISQILPVRREIRPAFRDLVVDRPEAAMQETMHPARHGRPATPAVDPALNPYASQESAQPMAAAGAPYMPARGGLPPAMLGPRNPAQFPARPAPPSVEPRQKLSTAVVMLGLMAIFTIAGWLYVDVETRKRVFEWAQSHWSRWVDQPTTPKLPPPPSDDPLGALAGEKFLANPKPVPAPAPVVDQPQPERTDVARRAPEPAPQPADRPVITPPVEQPTRQPTPVVEAPKVVTPPPQAEVTIAPPAPRPQPSPAPSQAGERRPDGGVAEVQVTADINEAIATARRLNALALDAERRGDWAAAVKLYEQIESLPPEAWPGSLQVNLQIARTRAAQQ